MEESVSKEDNSQTRLDQLQVLTPFSLNLETISARTVPCDGNNLLRNSVSPQNLEFRRNVKKIIKPFITTIGIQFQSISFTSLNHHSTTKHCKLTQPNLNAFTRSSAESTSSAPFLGGKRITGIPLPRAYSAPPQSANIIQELSVIDT